jgi:hypothetical protein
MSRRNSPTTFRPAEPASAPASSPAAADCGDAADPAHEASRAGTSSPEFGRLLDLVRRTAEVRPALLDRVRRRLCSGHYFTAQAAQQTAEALLHFSC